ncbi:MAG: hypothetical protein K2X66_07495 [Cyanobacteria bacterium]|nr:hypothetical protein [Cyanobacteriota bacterium]
MISIHQHHPQIHPVALKNKATTGQPFPTPVPFGNFRLSTNKGDSSEGLEEYGDKKLFNIPPTSWFFDKRLMAFVLAEKWTANGKGIPFVRVQMNKVVQSEGEIREACKGLWQKFIINGTFQREIKEGIQKLTTLENGSGAPPSEIPIRLYSKGGGDFTLRKTPLPQKNQSKNPQRIGNASSSIYYLEYRSKSPSKLLNRVIVPLVLRQSLVLLPQAPENSLHQYRIKLMPSVENRRIQAFVELFITKAPTEEGVGSSGAILNNTPRQMGDIYDVGLEKTFTSIFETSELLKELYLT